MDTFSLIGFAVVTAILSCTVRQFNNAAGMNVVLAGGACILLSIIAKVSGVAAALSSVAASGGLDGESVAVIVQGSRRDGTCRKNGVDRKNNAYDARSAAYSQNHGNADGTCSKQFHTMRNITVCGYKTV